MTLFCVRRGLQRLLKNLNNEGKEGTEKNVDAESDRENDFCKNLDKNGNCCIMDCNGKSEGDIKKLYASIEGEVFFGKKRGAGKRGENEPNVEKWGVCGGEEMFDAHSSVNFLWAVQFKKAAEEIL